MASEKELIDALELIRDECKKHNQCTECMLRNNDDRCGVMEDQSGYGFEAPSQWNIKNDHGIPRILL